MKKEYCYIDIHIKNNKLTNWGTTPHATHTGDTEDKHVHRIFLTKGQYNKLIRKLG